MLMDEYYDQADLPEGFRELIGMNGKALEYFCAMTAEQRRRTVQKARRCTSRDEMEAFVNGMVGWEQGHPPFQL